jgi:hypothetical protein
MVYGIISIAVYLFYLIWVLVSEDRAGPVDQEFKAFSCGDATIKLIAVMGQGFMIQVFLVPFLQKLKNGRE